DLAPPDLGEAPAGGDRPRASWRGLAAHAAPPLPPAPAGRSRPDDSVAFAPCGPLVIPAAAMARGRHRGEPGHRAASSRLPHAAPGSRLFAATLLGRDDRCGRVD